MISSLTDSTLPLPSRHSLARGPPGFVLLLLKLLGQNFAWRDNGAVCKEVGNWGHWEGRREGNHKAQQRVCYTSVFLSILYLTRMSLLVGAKPKRSDF